MRGHAPLPLNIHEEGAWLRARGEARHPAPGGTRVGHARRPRAWLLPPARPTTAPPGRWVGGRGQRDPVRTETAPGDWLVFVKKKINNSKWGLFGRHEARPAPARVPAAGSARRTEGRFPFPEGSVARPPPQHHPGDGPAAALGPRGSFGGEPRAPLSPPGTSWAGSRPSHRGAAAGTPAVRENGPRGTGSGRGSERAEARYNRGKQNTKTTPKLTSSSTAGSPAHPRAEAARPHGWEQPCGHRARPPPRSRPRGGAARCLQLRLRA